MKPITSIDQIVKLATAGYTDWLAHGHVKVVERGDLLLFDYTTGAHIANQWTYFEQVCRGLMINRRTGEIVARPFDKFFYWLEGGRKVNGHIVTVTEKVDGSLGILYRHKGEYHITTKGSFFSPQARWATKFLRDHFDLSDLPDDLTLMFEIIYPQNRIVVDYGETEDLVLLAARNRHTGDYLPYFPDLFEMGQDYGFTLPTVYSFNSVDDIIANTGVIDSNREGWIAEFSDGQRFKFKIDEYVEIHRYLRMLDFPSILQKIRFGEVDRLLEVVPDAFLDDTKRWVGEIRDIVNDLRVQVDAVYSVADTSSRPALEAWARDHHPSLEVYLLAKFDGDNLDKVILDNAFTERLDIEAER